VLNLGKLAPKSSNLVIPGKSVLSNTWHQMSTEPGELFSSRFIAAAFG
jgi:hypothetical protein